MKERFAWGVIYLNLPLWVAVGILAFGFGEWGVVKVLVSVNVALLLSSFILIHLDEIAGKE